MVGRHADEGLHPQAALGTGELGRASKGIWATGVQGNPYFARFDPRAERRGRWIPAATRRHILFHDCQPGSVMNYYDVVLKLSLVYRSPVMPTLV